MTWPQLVVMICVLQRGGADPCSDEACDGETASGSVMLQMHRFKKPTIVLGSDGSSEVKAATGGESHGSVNSTDTENELIDRQHSEQEAAVTRGKSLEMAIADVSAKSGRVNLTSMVIQRHRDMQCAKDEPLSEQGWQNIQAHCCMHLLDLYSRRVIADLGLDICHEGCYNGFHLQFHCNPDNSLEDYRKRIIDSQTDKCWCFAPVGQCEGPGRGVGLPAERDCSEFESDRPRNPDAHRRRRCGTAATTTTTPPPAGVTTTTTTRIPSSSRLCGLPPEVQQYSLITLGDANLSSHEVYKGLAIGGRLSDSTPDQSTNVAGDSFANSRGPGNWNFKAGWEEGKALSDVFDWGHFMWLAQNMDWLYEKEGDYKVRVFLEGGTYSAAGNGWGLNWGGQGEDNGKTLMVFRTNEDIQLVGTSNGRQYGPSVLAPFSAVTLDGSAGFADGFIIAKQFGPSGTFPSVGENAGSLQLHGDGYKGPVKCADWLNPDVGAVLTTTPPTAGRIGGGVDGGRLDSALPPVHTAAPATPTTTPTTTTPTTTPTTVPTTPTTTTPIAGCKGSTKDIFLVIDASKSVKSSGWEAESVFASRLIQEITAEGNPNKHQINLQWFNADTRPIGASGGYNSVGRFGTDAKSIRNALAGTTYASIRTGSTDHPQVYMTADMAFKDSSSGAVPVNKKVLVMITDGETHKGKACGKLGRSALEAKIGKCTTKNGHVCGPRGCDLEKCMCGVYNAQLFKEKGHELIIVGIANLNHIGATQAGIFNAIMKESASPGRSYLAANFQDLVNLVVPVVERLCQ